jgi:archaellum component FlaF (FlaF/FlaG flagellin family)
MQKVTYVVVCWISFSLINRYVLTIKFSGMKPSSLIYLFSTFLQLQTDSVQNILAKQNTRMYDIVYYHLTCSGKSLLHMASEHKQHDVVFNKTLLTDEINSYIFPLQLQQIIFNCTHQHLTGLFNALLSNHLR